MESSSSELSPLESLHNLDGGLVQSDHGKMMSCYLIQPQIQHQIQTQRHAGYLMNGEESVWLDLCSVSGIFSNIYWNCYGLETFHYFIGMLLILGLPGIL